MKSVCEWLQCLQFCQAGPPNMNCFKYFAKIISFLFYVYKIYEQLFLRNTLLQISLIESIFYKKIYKWDIEWQRVVQRVTTNNNESDNKWQWVVQRMTASDNEWQQMTMSYSEWQQVVKRMKTVQYTMKNKWCHFFCDCFKGWMAAIRLIK